MHSFLASLTEKIFVSLFNKPFFLSVAKFPTAWYNKWYDMIFMTLDRLSKSYRNLVNSCRAICSAFFLSHLYLKRKRERRSERKREIGIRLSSHSADFVSLKIIREYCNYTTTKMHVNISINIHLHEHIWDEKLGRLAQCQFLVCQEIFPISRGNFYQKGTLITKVINPEITR